MTIWKRNPKGSLRRSSMLTRSEFFRIQQYKNRAFFDDELTARNFSTFDGDDSSSLEMQNPPVLVGDFEISVDIAGSNLTKDQAIINSSEIFAGVEGEILLYIDNPDGLQLLIKQETGFSRTTLCSQLDVLNGKLNNLKLKRESGVISLSLNGSNTGETINYSGDIRFSEGLFFGGVGVGRYFDGIAANLQIKANGNTYNFPLNKALGTDSETSNGLTLDYVNVVQRAEYFFDSQLNGWTGGNIYTKSIIENPQSVGDQWTYLGVGRWQLNGDGDPNSLRFILGSSQPNMGYVLFDIESISGGSLTCAQTSITSDSRFDTIGNKIFYYDDIQPITEIQFKRAVGSVQSVIKNIKHYDADKVFLIG